MKAELPTLLACMKPGICYTVGELAKVLHTSTSVASGLVTSGIQNAKIESGPKMNEAKTFLLFGTRKRPENEVPNCLAPFVEMDYEAERKRMSNIRNLREGIGRR